MFLVGMLSWWYSKGWVRCAGLISGRLRTSADLFSIGLLIRTWFSPYKQISADTTGTSFPEKVRAFFDRLLSRIIGFVIRTFMMLFGVIVILAQSILGLVFLVFWLIIPILPIVGLILMSIEWMPIWKI